MKFTMGAEKPGSVIIVGWMCKPHRYLWLIADWAFEILELAPFGCVGESGEARGSLSMGDCLILLGHSEQPHPGEPGRIPIEGDRFPASREGP